MIFVLIYFLVIVFVFVLRMLFSFSFVLVFVNKNHTAFNVMHLLQAFSTEIVYTVMQQLTTFQLT